MLFNPWVKKKVLIMVKAYPQASQKYGETVCTAGITEEGEWIRIYPLPFRLISKSKQFSKYQWIELEVQRNPNDNREQSFRPNIDSIKILTPKPLPTKNGWELRNQYVLPTVSPSLEYLKDNYPKTSLGIIKPREIFEVIAEKNVPKEEILEYYQQLSIFEEENEARTPFIPLSYKFSYRFACNDEKCKKSHKLSIIDWELGALVNNLRRAGNNEETIKDKVILKFYNELCSPSKDTHFIVGNKYPYRDAFMILGVYYPDVVRQLSIFEL
jgi:hypothetical protein